ncbi:MAG: UDP-3-O-acyl-N-acetylglucosamine deacetylase [Pirellulales bacterium]|nr:UDP-3-O-acyl-N-acetylglucosamine deacetylase [Pirellulales bacterium]
MSFSRLQQTISRPAIVSGYGYWSGNDVRVEFRPAEANAGITFVRDDLGSQARVPARAEYRMQVPRRTNLSYQGVQVEMVEHIMAALAGLQIDNCEVGVDQAEMPGCDGSSLAFVQALDAVGVVQQTAAAHRIEITESVRLASGASWIEAHPDPARKYSLEFELDYPHDAVIGQQAIAVEMTPDQFRREIAPCRTFVLQREAEAMIRQGLGKRVTPRDLLVFDEQGPVENVLRFENECARHKTLDVIGDMALTGCEIAGRIVAHRSSHQLNAALAGELVSRFATVQSLRATA